MADKQPQSFRTDNRARVLGSFMNNLTSLSRLQAGAPTYAEISLGIVGWQCGQKRSSPLFADCVEAGLLEVCGEHDGTEFDIGLEGEEPGFGQ